MAIFNNSPNKSDVLFLRVVLQHANEVLNHLRAQNIINTKIKMGKDKQFLYIPILEPPRNLSNLKQDFKILLISSHELDFEIQKRNPKKKKTLKAALKSKLPSEFYGIIPNSFDIIGDIAIIELNREELAPLNPYKEIIGQTIIDMHSNIRTVLEKQGDVEGIFRTRKFGYVAGERKTETHYKENNCDFRLDVEETFFTPRLSFERNRIASISTKYNHFGFIWDMFCGVGPFFIQIAKKHPDVRIISTDINPKAIKYAHKNIQLNKLKNQIYCIKQDVNHMPLKFDNIDLNHNVSRVIMNLPEKNLNFLHLLVPVMSPKGILLHIYQFNEKPSPIDHAKATLLQALKPLPLRVDTFVNGRIVKPYSPALDTTVLDVILRK